MTLDKGIESESLKQTLARSSIELTVDVANSNPNAVQSGGHQRISLVPVILSSLTSFSINCIVMEAVALNTQIPFLSEARTQNSSPAGAILARPPCMRGSVLTDSEHTIKS
jgi:hypothetical protein